MPPWAENDHKRREYRRKKRGVRGGGRKKEHLKTTHGPGERTRGDVTISAATSSNKRKKKEQGDNTSMPPLIVFTLRGQDNACRKGGNS